MYDFDLPMPLMLPMPQQPILLEAHPAEPAKKQEKKSRKTFYGTSSCNTCAYCWKHYLSLTPNQVKKRKCFERQCDALKVFPDHPFIQQREEMKKKRKTRKQQREQMYLEATHRV